MSEFIEDVLEDFIDVYKYGKYYNPANKHYDSVGWVGCDKCEKEHLDVCIGYEDIDLCLKCMCDIGYFLNDR